MELQFGTAGIRGIMGPAPGQMNEETVRAASLGVAGWLKKRRSAAQVAAQDAAAEAPLVLIARDSRNQSLAFAMETARTLQSCGVRALLFEDICPVPVLSFAVRHLHADAGVMITASHNPKEYNGYKLYGPSGGQVLPEDAQIVQEEIRKASEFFERTGGEKAGFASEEAFEPSYVPDEVYHAYLDALRSASNAPKQGETMHVDAQECKAQENGNFGRLESLKKGEAFEQPAPSGALRVLYTPLNGSGLKPVSELLAADGYEMFVVPEQAQPDGDFTTVGQPNPELASAYRLALEYAREFQPDLILATDPDCDRVGAMVPAAQSVAQKSSGSQGDAASDETLRYRLLSGNDLGVLVLSYLCDTRDMSGKTFISSFVSTPLADRIAEAHGMSVRKTPVGFKHIAAGMDELQEAFGFAFEESNGMILGLYTRDKDGVLGSRLICQAADYYRTHRPGGALLSSCDTGKAISCEPGALSALAALNEAFGPVCAKTVDVAADPNAPKPETKTFDYDDGSRVVVRPSGTEPKIKYYFFAPSAERLQDLKRQFGV